jgi:hypothetical protein
MARDIHFENSIIYLIPNAVILCDFGLWRAAQLITVARTPAISQPAPATSQ